ncbi:MAG: aminoacetone oxidase family FAD-binding enzyme [Kiritimatiellia bacterium]
MNILVAGGGAAGFFAAIEARRNFPGAEVLLVEKSREWLAKVSISGGGRCNVTHDCTDPKRLAANYPRGARELLGPFHRFNPAHTVEWFGSRGVELKAEADGRMFPVTDSSQTVVDCLLREARAAGVRMDNLRGVAGASFEAASGRFSVRLSDQTTLAADRLMIATGGNLNSGGWEAAAQLGHTIETPVPSLFTFHIADPVLEGLSGITVPDVELSIPGTRLAQRGPLLVTHWGLSGPAVLKLSAWGARDLHGREYRFPVKVNFAPGRNEAWIREGIFRMRTEHGRSKVVNQRLVDMPQRLWERLVGMAGAGDVLWAMLPRAAAEKLAAALAGLVLEVGGKSMNKDEFVTCGGVRLSEIDFRTFESRVQPGLFFAGEVLDIDGITGGFNFQAAWTGGWTVGQSIGRPSANPAPDGNVVDSGPS